jgi:hypothetical protein
MAFKNEYIPPLERETSESLKKARRAMRTMYGKVCRAAAITMLGMLTACGQIDLKWSEEVQLEDGQVIVVKRTAQGKQLGELGGPGGWEQKAMSVEFSPSATGKNPPVWNTAYVPILIDHQTPEETWSIVATFYTCQGWHDLGRPALPYVEYQSNQGGPWEIAPLEPRLIGRPTNMLANVSSKRQPSFISLQEKKKRDDNAGDKYQKIIAVWHTNC